MSYIARLLLMVSPWKWYGAGAVAALVLSGLGVQTWRLHSSQAREAKAEAQIAQIKQQWAWRVADSQALRAQMEVLARAEETRRTEAIRSIVDETVRQAQAVAADAVAANAASERLSDRVSSLVTAARRRAGHPSTAEGSTLTAETLDLLAVMQRRIDEAASGISSYADAERVGHEAAVHSYQALGK